MALTAAEFVVLKEIFPELSWMGEDAWNSVADYADLRSWLNELAWADNWEPDGCDLQRALKLRENRVHVRETCRDYFGPENVPNINDPGDETWA